MIEDSEQIISFAPKLIALGLCLLVFAGTIVELMTGFMRDIFALIAGMGR